jgi:hypothetical protein
MNLPPSDGADSKAESSEPSTARRVIDRKLLDEIFGDLLPETTGDERGSGSSADGYSEQWYRDNRPPHHGG